MKAMILAGGFGTRLSEESAVRPKPMIEVGHRPILWHIMKIYAAHGITEFVICCGYKSHVIKEYFSSFFLHGADVTFDLSKRDVEIHQRGEEDWKVTCVETGENSMTGGRIRRARDYIGDEAFCLTYGDGVSDVDVTKLVDFHRQSGLKATLTAVKPPGRFGAFTLDERSTRVEGFREKPDGDGAWINGGFFVLEPSAIDYVDDDLMVWEREPLERLSAEHQLGAFRHDGFWQPMDTLRDKNVLEDLWQSGEAPWKVW